MSYEEIDRSVYGNDVFTNGAEGRYAKPNDASEKKKRAPKAPVVTTTTTEGTTEPTEEVVKTKKKSRKAQENGTTLNEEEPPTDGEAVAKPKKKRAPKIESNNENIDPIPDVEDQPIKKKKSKAPKITTAIDEDPPIYDSELGEPTIKVKKPKKHKTPKISADAFPDEQPNEYSINPDLNNGGAYNLTTGDISYDAPPAYSTEAEQTAPRLERSDYEAAIFDAYNNLGSKLNFAEFFSNDQWDIIHKPKSARVEPKSRIRKILPGGNSDKPPGAKSRNAKGGFLNRIRSGMGTLVRDENNLIFGEHSKYELAYPEDEDEDVDTDDLHRYAQKLRELEDTDREVNPEFLVLRDGKTVYAVHEADADGKMTFSTRKPIYDRAHDQAPDEASEKRTFLSRIRKNPFARNKDKESKGNNSPQLSNGTPDPSGKRSKRKSHNKITDDDMGTTANGVPLLD